MTCSLKLHAVPSTSIAGRNDAAAAPEGGVTAKRNVVSSPAFAFQAIAGRTRSVTLAGKASARCVAQYLRFVQAA